MSPTLRSTIRRKLLRWYDKNKRDLPWRRTRDPYAIWISETMLQQTRVAVVIPYYERFLAEFPTIDALSRARLSRVLRLWAGLGYYRRAANLHRAARQIVGRHAGTMPQEFRQLRALSGIGDYTAGALLSIAFGKRYPAIDGNVRRVIGRLTRTADDQRIRNTATALVPANRPGEFNQALMELGATICTPHHRRCPECALLDACASKTGSAPSRLRRKAALSAVRWPLALVRRGTKILLRRRMAGGLLGGLWELPGGEIRNRETIEAALRRHLGELGCPLPRARKLGAVRHAITFRRIVAPVFLYDLPQQNNFSLPAARFRWLEPEKVIDQATSSMTVKACRLLLQ